MRRDHSIDGVLSGLLVLGATLTTLAAEQAARPQAEKLSPVAKYEVRTAAIRVKLSESGEIVGISLGGEHATRNVRGGTHLAGCRHIGPTIVTPLDGGGFKFMYSLASENPRRECLLVERFVPTQDSVRWEIAIRGTGGPWTTAVSTQLQYPHADSCSFWTAWSDPDHRSDGWRDPLEFRPLTTATWTYANMHNSCPVEGDFIAIPVATVIEPTADAALSLVLSPEDTLLDTNLSTTSGGSIAFHRTRHRLGEGRTVRFAMDLVGHLADWRGVLGWMTRRYPQYFDPINSKANEMAGCGAYSGDENPVDVAQLKRMAFRVNWKLSDDFPYMGMFLPPLDDQDERWERSCDEACPPNKPRWTSFRRLNDYARYMREQGFYVLNYFNVTEFGKNMKDLPAPAGRKDDPSLWKSPVKYLKLRLPKGYLQPPIGTCYGAWVTDVGDPDYQRFMLEQARRYIERIPDSSGICIDRMDWLRYYNSGADDGVSWVDGKPARSLYQSWRGFMSLLGPLMHDAGKVIFVNNHIKRLELLRQVDGVYCEFCQTGPALNATGLLCLHRPALGWTSGEQDIRPDSDAFFQRHLHMGVYPTAPYPGNNHCICPNPWVDEQYLAYGPLLDALRGKRWVLLPHCVQVTGNAAKINLFKVPGGYAMPVTFGGQAKSVEIVLCGLPKLSDKTRTEALHPGVKNPVEVGLRRNEAAVVMTVPLHRGCAMVRIVD